MLVTTTFKLQTIQSKYHSIHFVKTKDTYIVFEKVSGEFVPVEAYDDILKVLSRLIKSVPRSIVVNSLYQECLGGDWDSEILLSVGSLKRTIHGVKMLTHKIPSSPDLWYNQVY